MTNKDASIIIGNIPIEGDDCYTIAEYQEAKARAIQALEQQPMRDATEEERKSVKDYIESISKPTGVQFEAQHCEDCISRTELLAKIDEERKHLLELKMDGAEHIIVHHARRIIEDMPPVTPSNADTKEAYLKGYDYGVKDWFKSKTQPCEDAVSREAVKNGMIKYGFHAPDMTVTEFVEDCLPSVTPQYTDEEIDKIQEIEQAYVDKMVELAVEEARKKWLNSFDTNSATKCFEAVNILKERLEEKE